MKSHYDFSKMKGKKNPYIKYLKQPVTMRLDFARQVLKPGGGLLVKLFQGEGFEAYHNELKQHFSRVVMRKPKASRARSREIYALAAGFKAE